jgi:hypothetical protein
MVWQEILLFTNLSEIDSRSDLEPDIFASALDLLFPNLNEIAFLHRQRGGIKLLWPGFFPKTTGHEEPVAGDVKPIE